MENLIDHLYELFSKCPVVCIDSRKVTSGCLFFGLKGDHVDGSSYGASAIDRGASVAIVQSGACEEKPGVLVVENPLTVLQELARCHRSKIDIPIIGITGSNGKTTTKELVHRVLSTTFSVAATQGNLNNHIGVPLTVLSITRAHQLAIIEMGANHIGEISQLCEIAQPTHGIVTNIGKAHLEGFGDLEGVKRAKAELYDSLAAGQGVAFINMNENFLEELSENVRNRVRYRIIDQVGYDQIDYRFVAKISTDTTRMSFVDKSGNAWEAKSQLFGSFNHDNVATAIATGLFFDIPGDEICAAIESYVPQNNRAQRIRIGSNTFILDAYNANPTSMTAAMMSFQSIDHPRKMMILGSMMELGDYARVEHLKVASLAAAIADTITIYVGDHFKESATKVGAKWYPNTELLAQDLKSYQLSDTLCLVKGSRAMHLENLIDLLQ